MSHLRHYMLQPNNTEEQALSQASGPSCAKFIESTTLASLSQRRALVTEVEGMLRDLRTKYLEDLETLSGPSQARLGVAVAADLIIRCLLSAA